MYISLIKVVHSTRFEKLNKFCGVLGDYKEEHNISKADI